MKIVFMGTPDFASGILKAILESEKHDVCAVVTAIDKPAGRGMQTMKSSVKQLAEKHQLTLLQPEKLKDPAFVECLESLHADLFVVVAFRMLPEVVWKIPPKGTINLHASLLPHYRGAAPINWAIINGETKTGVTTFFINEKIDEGNIILSEKTNILPDDNAGSLHDKLLHLGAKVLLNTLEQIENNTYKEQKQILSPHLKLAPKIFKKDCLINWNLTATAIHNLIRGLSPYPTAYTLFADKNKHENIIKIFKSSTNLASHHLPPGLIETDNKQYLRIACKDGFIYVEELQMSGKKRMDIKEFLLGNKLMHLTQCF